MKKGKESFLFVICCIVMLALVIYAGLSKRVVETTEINYNGTQVFINKKADGTYDIWNDEHCISNVKTLSECEDRMQDFFSKTNDKKEGKSVEGTIVEIIPKNIMGYNYEILRINDNTNSVSKYITPISKEEGRYYLGEKNVFDYFENIEGEALIQP